MKSTIFCLESDDIRLYREQQSRRKWEMLTFGILLVVFIALVVTLIIQAKSDFISLN